MFGVTFNAGASRSAIRDAVAQLDDMTPVYEDIGEYLLRNRRQRFAQGKGPDGKAWAPKRQSTLERYKRLGYGTLARPLIGPSKALSRQIQRIVSRNGVIIGSAQVYSRVMQEGAAKGAFGTDSRGRPIPWGRIPARPWIDLSAEEDKGIVSIVEEHLQDLLNAG